MKTTAWVGGALALLLSFAVTEASETLRGTIENVDGGTLVVKTREGTIRNVRLPDNANIYALNPATVADLKPGRFAGSSPNPKPVAARRYWKYISSIAILQPIHSTSRSLA